MRVLVGEDWFDRASRRRSSGVVALIVAMLASMMVVIAPPARAAEIDWEGTELLGKATDHSITINVVPGEDVAIRYIYGTSASNLKQSTGGFVDVDADEVYEITIDCLTANTQYFYRMEYREPDDLGNVIQRPIYDFRTGRSSGESFTFTLIADSHLGSTGGSADRYRDATFNVADDEPDLHFDLGDTFMVDIDASPNQAAVDQLYLTQRDYFGNFAHSTPVYLAMGNHEDEEGWNLDDCAGASCFSTGHANIEGRKL
ncbi:MAG: metallophosphoesterase, partial [Acidimicrobiia bacterium]